MDIPLSVVAYRCHNILKNYPSPLYEHLPRFFGTHGDDFYKKLNSRSDLALILGVLKRYRSAEESDDPYTMHLWSQIDPIVPNVAYKPCLLATTPHLPTPPRDKLNHICNHHCEGQVPPITTPRLVLLIPTSC
ncbi:hypothetical protein PROFUN_16601 [Planoprotostelium fungivorum]|uniref:Uncharacterized protein n=1 Tax=Planoprotostelium fungivorum TaxID=1890364 RepID=A0A2P6MQA4_9EUKA|nr:hypothetical protein PROFUN_16601 [Planoprotostelium fungivorum]